MSVTPDKDPNYIYAHPYATLIADEYRMRGGYCIVRPGGTDDHLMLLTLAGRGSRISPFWKTCRPSPTWRVSPFHGRTTSARGPAHTTDPDTDSETQFDRTRDAASNQSDGPPLRPAALRLEKLVADRRNHMVNADAELVRH